MLRNWDQARDHFERDLELSSALRNQRSIAMMYNNIGDALLGLGRLEAAEASYREAMAMYEKRSDLMGARLFKPGTSGSVSPVQQA